MVFMALNDLTYHLCNLTIEIALDHRARYFGTPSMTSGNRCHHFHIGLSFLAPGNVDSLRNSE